MLLPRLPERTSQDGSPFGAAQKKERLAMTEATRGGTFVSRLEELTSLSIAEHRRIREKLISDLCIHLNVRVVAMLVLGAL